MFRAFFCFWAGGPLLFGFKQSKLFDADFADNHGFGRYILMETACRCFHFADFTDNVHAGSDFTENGIAVALRGFAFEIQKVVVGRIDKELAGCGIRIAGARHGDGADIIFQAVVCFVVDGFIGGLLNHFLGKSAALNHKIVDNAVENRVVVKTFFGIIDKVCHGFRRFDFIQLQLDVAHIGFNHGMGNRLRLHGE